VVPELFERLCTEVTTEKEIEKRTGINGEERKIKKLLFTFKEKKGIFFSLVGE